MDPKFIKKHKASETFIIKKGSFFENDVTLPGNATIGAGTSFWGDLVVHGNLDLCSGSTVKGNIMAERAVIGADCKIEGNLKVVGNLAIMDRTHIGGLVYSGGNLKIRPGVSARAVECAGDIEVNGRTNIKSISSGRKIVARKD